MFVYLLHVVFVRDDGPVVEKRVIEGVREQPAEALGSVAARWAPAVVQAEADEAQTADGHAEEQQIVFLLRLVPASLGNGRRGANYFQRIIWGKLSSEQS